LADPVVWLTASIAGLAGFTAWLIKAFITHLEKDIDYSRRTATRGVETAERATSVAEQRSGQ
jgi:hypothetical protein